MGDMHFSFNTMGQLHMIYMLVVACPIGMIHNLMDLDSLWNHVVDLPFILFHDLSNNML